MDLTQLTIIVVTIVLTLLIVVLGVQVWLILKEVRISLQKMNKMLDDAGKVSGAVSEGVVGMTGFMNGLKTGLSAVSSILKKKDED